MRRKGAEVQEGVVRRCPADEPGPHGLPPTDHGLTSYFWILTRRSMYPSFTSTPMIWNGRFCVAFAIWALIGPSRSRPRPLGSGIGPSWVLTISTVNLPSLLPGRRVISALTARLLPTPG